MQIDNMLPSRDNAFTSLMTADKKGRQKPAFAPKTLVKYMDRFHELIENAKNQGQNIDIEEIEQAFAGTGPTTVRKYLRQYLNIRMNDIRHVTGFYPSAETIITMAERDLGPVRGENLAAINEHCKTTVESISKPRHARFLSGQLGEFISGDIVSMPKGRLVDFLFDEYVTFIREADNGLVSIAGTLNEAIFVRGLVNGGLVSARDIIETGTRSDGDIKVQHHGPGGNVELLYVEIKSYAARERLLRGLQDIQHPLKIGVGFFNNPSEFNPGRTDTLLAAGPLAIYMPRFTWEKVSEDSKIKVTRLGHSLYRPLDMLIDDMKGFVGKGKLPAFNHRP